MRLTSTVDFGGVVGEEEMARETPVDENFAGKRGMRRMAGSCRWTIDASNRLLYCGSRTRKIAVLVLWLMAIWHLMCQNSELYDLFALVVAHIEGSRNEERQKGGGSFDQVIFVRFGPVG